MKIYDDFSVLQSLWKLKLIPAVFDDGDDDDDGGGGGGDAEADVYLQVF